MDTRDSIAGTRLLGVDFTSAPRCAKPITAVRARPGRAASVVIDSIDTLDSFERFDALLAELGPWVGGFDFPFGLPRSAVAELDWPLDWRALVAFCATLGRPAFRARLDAHRAARAIGDRYVHRAVDWSAASHSPLKLVNPPVALMFLEGAPRLARAGVTVPGIVAGDPSRVAVEAYPGWLVRSITRASYKSDTRSKQTTERAAVRTRVVAALRGGEHGLGIRLEASAAILDRAQTDASGDTLDAIVCAIQAGWAVQRDRFGLPAGVDPIEGWIAGVPAPRPSPAA
jgi:hypothetical protein